MNYSSKNFLRPRVVGGLAAFLSSLAFLTALAAPTDETTASDQAAVVEQPALDPAGLALAMSLETEPAPQPIESEWPYPGTEPAPQPIESEWPYPDAPVMQAKQTVCYDDFGDVTECENDQPDQYTLARHSAGNMQFDRVACEPQINDADPMGCLSQE
jgi:hypothetical protein